MREVSLELVKNLGPDLRGRRLSSPNIDYEGRAVALAMPPAAPVTITFAPGASKSAYVEDVYGPRDLYSTDALIWSGSDLKEVPLRGLDVYGPLVQQFPDGRILLAGIIDRSTSPSAYVFSVAGERLRTLDIGYAFEHVYVERDDSIWVSYFDEGAEGKFGRSGLVRFDDEGNKQWGFNENRGAAPGIFDCYALNVGSDEIWLSAYTEFDLVRIRGDDIRHWKHPIRGARAIAGDGDDVVFFGGYGDEGSSCRLAGCGMAQLEEVQEIVLRLPDGRLLADLESPEGDATPPYWVVGRDDALHVFAEDRWYRTRVADTVDFR